MFETVDFVYKKQSGEVFRRLRSNRFCLLFQSLTGKPSRLGGLNFIFSKHL